MAKATLHDSGYERQALDGYWTRPWVTQWLLDASPPLTSGPPPSVVWEPACGAGWISDVLSARGYDVLSTDIFDHGYAKLDGVRDFLGVSKIDPAINVIFTNPPYGVKGVPGFPDATAEAFVRHALDLTKPGGGKVIMLLRNEFDSAARRINLFDSHPFVVKYVLTRRPEWVDPQPGKKKSGPMHNYSWFEWDWSAPLDCDSITLYLQEPKKQDLKKVA